MAESGSAETAVAALPGRQRLAKTMAGCQKAGGGHPILQEDPTAVSDTRHASKGVTARPRGGEVEGLSAWWWLALPVAVLAGLSVLGLSAPDVYRTYVDGEQGLLEMSQAALMLASTVLAARMLAWPAVRRRWPLFGWLALATIGAGYVTGEELSWGQHLLNWSTPEYWAAVNDQNETNLHNVSSWLDQKPRALLELGVIAGGIVLPLAALRYPSIRSARAGIVVPPLLCLPSAAIAEAVRLVERVADWTGTKEMAVLIRPAEHQELYFYLFILFYLVVLSWRLRALDDPQAA